MPFQLEFTLRPAADSCQEPYPSNALSAKNALLLMLFIYPREPHYSWACSKTIYSTLLYWNMPFHSHHLYFIVYYN